MASGRSIVRSSATLTQTELRQRDKHKLLQIHPTVKVFGSTTGGWYASLATLKSNGIAVELWYDLWIGFPKHYDFWSGFSALGTANKALLSQRAGVSPDELATTELPTQTEKKKQDLYVRRTRPSPETLDHPVLEKLGAGGVFWGLYDPESKLRVQRAADFILSAVVILDAPSQLQLARMSIDELRRLAHAADLKPAKTKSATLTYLRNPYVAEYAKRIAKGRCDLCREKAPFETDAGPYLECHHIKWLKQDGDDSVQNTVALCPNCHRRMHFSNDKAAIAADVQKLEAHRKKEEGSSGQLSSANYAKK